MLRFPEGVLVTVDGVSYKKTVDGVSYKKYPGEYITCGECDEQDTHIEKFPDVHRKFDSYEIECGSGSICRRFGSIFYAVAIKNKRQSSEQKLIESLIGPTGHVERANVWTHLLAALLYIIYSSVRFATPMGQTNTVSSYLAHVSYSFFIATFVLSSVYHVCSANMFWSAVTRLGDYLGIYTGIAFGTLSDLAIVANNLEGLGWISVLDVFIGAFLITLFFGVRRCTVTVKDTRLAYMPKKCDLGLSRSTNVDLEHSALRAASGTAMSFSWLLVAPLAFQTLEEDCAWVFVGSRILGQLLLIGGMLLDNYVVYPDAWFENDKEPTRCVCKSKSKGCIITSHALWHIIALLSTVVSSIGSEYVILFSQNLKD
jgi:hypothetical protein